MLFEVPGMNLGAPKTDSKKIQKVQSVQSKNIDAVKKIPKLTHKFENDATTSKSKGKPSKEEVKESSHSRSVKSEPSKNAPAKKIEKMSGKSKLQQKMEEKLRGARFRYLNQKLYESHSHDALSHFQNNPEDFQKYHEGFRSQVVHWPVNPVEIFIEQIEKDLKHHKLLSVVDMGCGEAKIMRHFQENKELISRIKVHSFDLAQSHPGVVICDMTKVPLASSSVDIVIFCLSLMNTNFIEAIREAKRILKPKGGILRIAEVESRFENGPDTFIKAVEGIGFKKLVLNTKYKVFTIMEFLTTDLESKVMPSKSKNSSEIILKPCLYKKR